MPQATESTAVTREITIAAAPEVVWTFLVDEHKAASWMGQAAEFDPRPGGLYRVQVVPGHTARGEFVELDPPRRLVYTWGWEAGGDGTPSPVPPGSTTIEIELEPAGDATLLRFLHRDLPSAESAGSHAHGWDHYLPRLIAAAAGTDPGRDAWLDGDMRT
jgi:uncharacterized protein YndB with AHSA1/START domain